MMGLQYQPQQVARGPLLRKMLLLTLPMVSSYRQSTRIGLLRSLASSQRHRYLHHTQSRGFYIRLLARSCMGLGVR
jgi:hypothetical protein